MKKIFIILFACLFNLLAISQVPEKVSYQAVVRDSDYELVVNSTVKVELSIKQRSADGPVVYVETHSVKTNENGLVSLELGDGNVISGNFLNINWSDGAYYLETKVDPLGGVNYKIVGVSQILSVPYAFHSKSAETLTEPIFEYDPDFNAWDKDYNDLTNKPVIPTVPTNVSDFTNDAGYITTYTETDPLFSAWDKSSGILISKTQITDLDISSVGNDDFDLSNAAVGDLIQFDGTKWVKFTPDYLKTESDPDFNAWNKDYNDLTNKPVIPTVPTNISDFTNDAGYITTYTETDPEFTAWDKDYNDLTNKPVIPTVPTNVSDFNNDAGYITTYTETDPEFTAWNKSTGISITESQISDLGSYVDADNFDFSNVANGDLLRYNGTKWVKFTPNYITSETQDLDGVLTIDNSAGNKNITNLADPVDAQDAVTKSYVDALIARIEALENLEVVLLENGFIDYRDGNHYDVVKIGDQLWMAENLKYLPTVTFSADESDDKPRYYVYGYEGTDVEEAKATANYETYGVLYNWPAAMAGASSTNKNPSGVQGVCPDKWHLPSKNEWNILMNSLGGYLVSGGKLKEIGTDHWSVPNTGATDEYGFTVLPAGVRSGNLDEFRNIGNQGYLWSTTLTSPSNVNIISFGYDRTESVEDSEAKDYGISVRCVKD